jgi:hypothetical protein
MRAVAFETELIDNTINIPENFQEELALSKDKHVRVIVMIDESEINDELEIRKILNNKFLSGYDDAEDIYDHP